MTVPYRPSDPRFLAEPFPVYQRLRDLDPAHWSAELKGWVLTRYEDVKRVCLDGQMSSDRLRPFFLFEAVPTRIVEAGELADVDPTFQTLRNLNTPEEYRAALTEPLPLVTAEPGGPVHAAHLAAAELNGRPCGPGLVPLVSGDVVRLS